jgi:hypothetical protein
VTGLVGPAGVAFDQAGNLYVANAFGGHELYRFPPLPAGGGTAAHGESRRAL